MEAEVNSEMACSDVENDNIDNTECSTVLVQSSILQTFCSLANEIKKTKAFSKGWQQKDNKACLFLTFTILQGIENLKQEVKVKKGTV